MVDRRFYRAKGPWSLTAIATMLNAQLTRAEFADTPVHDIADLETADNGDVAMYCNHAHARQFAASNATAIITSPKFSTHSHKAPALLLTPNPKLAFALLGRAFYPRHSPFASAYRPADIALIEDDVKIGSGVVIGENVEIGERSSIAPNVVIGDGVIIGSDTFIGPNCNISYAVIGNRVSIAGNVSIGGEGFGFAHGPNGPARLAQVGRVIVEDDVDIGSNCAIDRGCLGDTVIGSRTAIDNLVQIGHNVKIGKCCILAGQVGIAGSTCLGDYVMVGGAASIADHLVIGTGARIAGKSGVMRNVRDGETVAGYPAMPIRQWHRQTARSKRLRGTKA